MTSKLHGRMQASSSALAISMNNAGCKKSTRSVVASSGGVPQVENTFEITRRALSSGIYVYVFVHVHVCLRVRVRVRMCMCMYV